MGTEVELKLSLPAEEQRRLLRQPLLKTAQSRQTQQLLNIYYDTPRLALRRRGIALRLRKQGGAWLQTVKCAGRSEAGLTTRPEWETPYAGQFEFEHIEDQSLRQWLSRPELVAKLSPLFEVNVRRTTWRFEPAPASAVLLTLDTGFIAARGRQSPISELELELESGPVDQLFALALELAAKLPVVPQTVSKAERGYRLYQGRGRAPSKFQTPALEADARPLTAFRAIALACLENQQGNLDGMLESDNPEFIHHMRVATRRLRACLQIFKSRLPVALTEALLPLRDLTVLLGQARDLDVVLGQIVLPVVETLPEEPRLEAMAKRLRDRQHAARERARDYLRSASYGRMLLSATALLHSSSFVEPTPEAETLATFAERRLKRMKQKVLRLTEQANVADPRSLHRLRIGIKRLRYALECFSSLTVGDKPQRVLRQLGDLQDRLGALNDLANAGPLLSDSAGTNGGLRAAMAMVAGWHAARHGELVAKIPAALEKLRRIKLPDLH